MSATDLLAAPETLDPALWRAHQLGRSREAAVRSGFDALDAQLPGGGWPRQALTELLLQHPGVGKMRLLAPALAGIAAAEPPAPRSAMLFDPPAPLCGWALAQLGVDAQRLMVIHGRDGAQGARHLLASADLLWALEQAPKSGQVGAVLAWLPLRLRRCAAPAAAGGAVARRAGVPDARHRGRPRPSPAPLRLALRSAGIDGLAQYVLKRRGPALTRVLRLALPPALAPVLRARRRRTAGCRGHRAGTVGAGRR